MSIKRICLAGFPLTKEFGITFFVTTEPAPTRQFYPSSISYILG